jgi:ABC-type antimicrobial peptide transport system permease subunit
MISTLYSLVAFYIVGAAYRSFQARNMEAALLLIAAIFVMLKNAPIGEMIWMGFPDIGRWLMNVPNTAAFRGIMIGTAIGAIGLGLRILLGKERAFLGGVEN